MNFFIKIFILCLLIMSTLPQSFPVVKAGTCISLSRALARGSVDGAGNGEVTKLQTFLFENGYLNVTPNGVFGPKTVVALIAFQKASGFSQTGGAGPMTRAKIKELSCRSRSMTATTTIKTVDTASKPPEVASTTNTVVPVLQGTRIPKNNKAVTTDLLSGALVSHEDTITLSWQLPFNPKTGVYNLKIDQGIIPLGLQQSWQGTLGGLGLIDGSHTFAVQYCASSSCSLGWSNIISVNISNNPDNYTLPTNTSSVTKPTLNFYGPALTSTPRPITDKVMLNWSTQQATRCNASSDNSLATDWSGQVAVSGDVTVVTRKGVTTYSLECFDINGNSSGKIDIPVNVSN